MAVVLHAMLVVLTVYTAPPAAIVDSLTARLDSVVTQRIAALERRWNITFDSTLRPKVQVAFPGDSSYVDLNHLQGVYYSDSMLISVMVDGTPSWPDKICVDHELFHAHCDQVSRHLGLGPWPNMTAVNWFTPAQAAALRLQNEGMAKSATEGRDNLPGSQWINVLPWTVKDCFRRDEVGKNFVYGGGRAMIQQLLDHVDLDTLVVYVITHPVMTDIQPFNQALIEWVRRARLDLHIDQPKKAAIINPVTSK